MACEYTEERRVEFSETDMAGMVHFANFFRYMERAEHAFFRSLGVTLHKTEGEAESGWVRVGAGCEYKKPLRYPDAFQVHLTLRKKGRSSLGYDFTFIDAAGDVAALGTLDVVHVRRDAPGAAFRAEAMPAEVADQLEAAPKDTLHPDTDA